MGWTMIWCPDRARAWEGHTDSWLLHIFWCLIMWHILPLNFHWTNLMLLCREGFCWKVFLWCWFYIHHSCCIRWSPCSRWRKWWFFVLCWFSVKSWRCFWWSAGLCSNKANMVSGFYPLFAVCFIKNLCNNFEMLDFLVYCVIDCWLKIQDVGSQSIE